MKVLEGFERYYPDSVCLLLVQTTIKVPQIHVCVIDGQWVD